MIITILQNFSDNKIILKEKTEEGMVQSTALQDTTILNKI